MDYGRYDPKAPTKPSKKRRSMRSHAAAAAAAASISSSARPSSLVTLPQTWSAIAAQGTNTKKSRRVAKHQAFVSKLRRTSLPNKSSRSGGTRGGISKRRRPSKKLVANLSSLLDVLPSLEAGGDGNGQKDDVLVTQNDNPPQDLHCAVTSKILRYNPLLMKKPGGLKQKEKIRRWEMEEFGKNLSQLHQPQPDSMDIGDDGADTTAVIPTTNRWAALRKRIVSSTEQCAAFQEIRTST